MDRLKEKNQFKAYKKEDDLEEYLLKFLVWIEKDIYSETTKRVNWLLEPRYMEITNGDVKWQITITGNDLRVQKWDGSAWVKSQDFIGS